MNQIVYLLNKKFPDLNLEYVINERNVVPTSEWSYTYDKYTDTFIILDKDTYKGYIVVYNDVDIYPVVREFEEVQRAHFPIY
ncbi:MAG: hypothetical protein GY853_15675 [PVC group bacterium]|nr:hypothetical protein [PVC group bacterium]